MSFRSWTLFGVVAAFVLIRLHVESAAANTLQNGSFTDVRGNMPSEWHLNEPVKDRGNASVEGSERVLVLRPKSNNTDPGSAFGVVQFFPADGYRSQRVQLSVALRAEGGATASAMALAFDNRDRITETAQILQQSSGMERKSTSINVPQNAKTVMIALSIIGPRGAAYFDDVTFASGTNISEEMPPSRSSTRTGGRRTSGRTSESVQAPAATEAVSEGFGFAWTPVMDEPLQGGPCNSWRCVGVGDPTIARAPDSRLLLWFTTVGIRKDEKNKLVADGPLIGRAVAAGGRSRLQFNFSPEAPVMPMGNAGDWDRHLETPSVRRDPTQNRWLMWYMGFKERSLLGFKDPCIGLAVSADSEGTRWDKTGPPIYCSKAGWDNMLITGPTAVPPEADGIWRVYYSGVGLTNKGVGLLTSTDGRNWTPHSKNPVFKTSKNDWDETVLEQSVVFARGRYWMWYSGYKGSLKNDTVISIGLATSNDGVNWTRNPEPVLRPGPEGSWYDLRILAPDVIVDNDGSLLMAAYGKSKRDSKDSAGSIGLWRSQ